MDETPTECTLFFNPGCSTCRRALELLEEKDVPVRVVEYLSTAPTRAELERVLVLLGTDDPREIIRSKEPVHDELGLAEADRDALLDAMAAHPILIQRPIAIRGDRAVVARPPERLLDLLD
ncbi:MAG TPA: arsenate reductase (glutaredoxin) [Candidatus Dormibacteraeota bacterium]|nr:arsenate reductase (glutaredoxin) [Candidatus Dormibacteraeota bacterium]